MARQIKLLVDPASITTGIRMHLIQHGGQQFAQGVYGDGQHDQIGCCQGLFLFTDAINQSQLDRPSGVRSVLFQPDHLRCQTCFFQIQCDGTSNQPQTDNRCLHFLFNLMRLWRPLPKQRPCRLKTFECVARPR